MIRAVLALLALAAFSAVQARPAGAEIYRPWCVHYVPQDNGTNCGFISYEQCMLTARGAGGTCMQNPWYLKYGSGERAAESTARPRRR